MRRPPIKLEAGSLTRIDTISTAFSQLCLRSADKTATESPGGLSGGRDPLIAGPVHTLSPSAHTPVRPRLQAAHRGPHRKQPLVLECFERVSKQSSGLLGQIRQTGRKSHTLLGWHGRVRPRRAPTIYGPRPSSTVTGKHQHGKGWKKRPFTEGL